MKNIMEENFDDAATPMLLRLAWKTYRTAIGEALAESGCDDMPRNGYYVIAAVSRGLNGKNIRKQVGLREANAELLMQVLIEKGYTKKNGGGYSLAERGEKAVKAGRAAIAKIDEEFIAKAGASALSKMKSALALIIDIN